VSRRQRGRGRTGRSRKKNGRRGGRRLFIRASESALGSFTRGRCHLGHKGREAATRIRQGTTSHYADKRKRTILSRPAPQKSRAKEGGGLKERYMERTSLLYFTTSSRPGRTDENGTEKRHTREGKRGSWARGGRGEGGPMLSGGTKPKTEWTSAFREHPRFARKKFPERVEDRRARLHQRNSGPRPLG